MSRRPKFSRRDNYWFWHSFVVCIFDNKFLSRPIVISDDMPTYWALIDAFYDFWWFWPTAVYTARVLYELTIGRFRILFYIVCGQKKTFHDGKKLMPSVITAYFGQTCFLSISQHRPEAPTWVVFCVHCCYGIVFICVSNKLVGGGVGFGPVSTAGMSWLGKCEWFTHKKLVGGRGNTFCANWAC